MRKLFGIAMFAAVAANASIIISPGNNPQPPEYNVLLTSGVTGTTVTGTFNEFPGLNAVFTSTQTLLEDASGQARVTAQAGNLTNLMISLSGGNTFGDLIFALNPPGGPGPNPTYSISVNGTTPVTPAAGTVTTGNQFFTILATGTDRISSVNIQSSGLSDVRQVRFSAIAPAGGGGGGAGDSPVPEPSTFVMLGGALAMFGFTKLRKTA